MILAPPHITSGLHHRFPKAQVGPPQHTMRARKRKTSSFLFHQLRQTEGRHASRRPWQDDSSVSRASQQCNKPPKIVLHLAHRIEQRGPSQARAFGRCRRLNNDCAKLARSHGHDRGRTGPGTGPVPVPVRSVRRSVHGLHEDRSGHCHPTVRASC